MISGGKVFPLTGVGRFTFDACEPIGRDGSGQADYSVEFGYVWLGGRLPDRKSVV